MAGSLQLRIMGQDLPQDSKLQTAGHQTFNHVLGRGKCCLSPRGIITMMSESFHSNGGRVNCRVLLAIAAFTAVLALTDPIIT